MEEEEEEEHDDINEICLYTPVQCLFTHTELRPQCNEYSVLTSYLEIRNLDTSYCIRNKDSKHTIQKVDSIKDVGILFDTRLNFKDHIQEKNKQSV